MICRTVFLISLLCISFTNTLFAQSQDNMDQRLQFLQERLDATQSRAIFWHWGWFAVSAGGMAYSIPYAIIKDGDEKTVHIVEAVKSAIGVVYLVVDPLEARHGSSKVPQDGPIEMRVAAAEKLLEANAKRSEERTDWTMYAGNTLIEGAGLGVDLAWGKTSDAWINFAIGMALGTLQIWSMPARPRTDWQEYQQRFNGAHHIKQSRWWISPSANFKGLAFNYVW